MERQEHGELASLPHCAGDIDAALMFFHDATGERKAKAGAVALGGEEGSEDILPVNAPGGLERHRRLRRTVELGLRRDQRSVAVHAGRVLDGVNGDAFATAGCHSCLTVAGEAIFILFERLWGFGLSSSLGGDRSED